MTEKVNSIENGKWKVENGELSGGVEAKFLFLFKEKVSFGGSENLQLQNIIRRRMTEKVNSIENGKWKMENVNLIIPYE